MDLAAHDQIRWHGRVCRGSRNAGLGIRQLDAGNRKRRDIESFDANSKCERAKIENMRLNYTSYMAPICSYLILLLTIGPIRHPTKMVKVIILVRNNKLLTSYVMYFISGK